MEVYNTYDAVFPRPDFELGSMPNKWLKSIRDWATKEPRIEAVYLFGSRACGKYGEHSDVDLALLLGGNEEDPERPFWKHNDERIKTELKALLPVPIDAHVLNWFRGADFVPDVLHHGIRIYFRAAA
jgi:predicted nucleotidyltransferase